MAGTKIRFLGKRFWHSHGRKALQIARASRSAQCFAFLIVTLLILTVTHVQADDSANQHAPVLLPPPAAPAAATATASTNTTPPISATTPPAPTAPVISGTTPANTVQSIDIPPPAATVPAAQESNTQQLQRMSDSGYSALHQHMADFLSSLRSQGVKVPETSTTAATTQPAPAPATTPTATPSTATAATPPAAQGGADDLDSLLYFDEAPKPAATPPVTAAATTPATTTATTPDATAQPVTAPTQTAATPPAPAEAELSPEAIQASVMKEIKTRNPLYTDKDIFTYAGTCLLLPNALKKCQSFTCNAPLSKDDPTIVEYKVLGEEGGKCYVSSSKLPAATPYQECIFSDSITRETYANGILELYYSGGKITPPAAGAQPALSYQIYTAYDTILAAQCTQNTGNGTMMPISQIRAEAEAKQTASLPVTTAAGQEDTTTTNDTTASKAGKSAATTDTASTEPDILEDTDDSDLADEEALDTIPLPEATAKQSATKEEPIEKKKKPRQLSEADKAYLALLDEKRKALPGSKKLSDKTNQTIDEISSAMAAEDSQDDDTPPDTEYIEVRHGKDGKASNKADGTSDGETDSNLQLSIKDQPSGYDSADIQAMLEMAYKALISGQISSAVSIYKTILSEQPENKAALFGLATSYHRDSQYAQAREIYTQILQIDPNYKEALNNFLVLVAEEAPENALIELEKLERINPKFSPIPAQIAMIYLKMNKPEKAERYLKRAVLLSPDNVVYKYNLAITSDRLGRKEQATTFYRQLLDAAGQGAIIPGSLEDIRKRLAYLESKP